MTWPMHDAGPTTPDPGHEEPWAEEPGPDDTDSLRRGRHAAPDPLPPLEGPMPGGGPSPAETTLPLALSWPAPPARPLRQPRFTPHGTPGPPGAPGMPPGWRRAAGRPGGPLRQPRFTPHGTPGQPGQPGGPARPPGWPAAPQAGTGSPGDPAKPTSQRSSLIRSGAGMAVGTLASRVTGFLRTFVFVAVLGSGPLANDYNNSNTLPNTVYYLMLGGIFTSVVVPLLVKAARRDPAHGEAYAQRIFTLGVVALFAVTLVATLAAGPLVDLYAAALKGTEHNLMVVWAYFFIPQIFFYGMSSLIGAILNTRGRFAAPMWTPVINNVVVIVVGGLYVAMTLGQAESPSTITTAEVRLLGIGTTLGVVAQTIALFPSLRRAGFRWRFTLGFRPGELAEMGRMTGWMSVYVITQWAANLVVQNVANYAGKHSQSGYSVYTYAWQFFQLPYAIIGISVITALLPRMSEHATARRYSLVRDDFSMGIRLSAVIVVPAAIFLAVLGAPIGEFMFAYGSNTISGGKNIGEVFGLFSLGLIPFMVTQLQLRVFYSFQDSRTAAFVGLLTMLTGIAGDVIALKTMNPADVVAGLAVAYGVANLVGALAGWALLLRRVGSLDGWAVARSLTRMHLATVPGLIFAVIVMIGARHVLHDPGRGYGLVVTVIGGGGAVGLYALCARSLRVAEFGFLTRTIAARFGRQSGRH